MFSQFGEQRRGGIGVSIGDHHLLTPRGRRSVMNLPKPDAPPVTIASPLMPQANTSPRTTGPSSFPATLRQIMRMWPVELSYRVDLDAYTKEVFGGVRTR